MYTNGVFLGIGPEVNLGKDLICEWITHNEARMAHGTAKVYQASLGKQDNVATSWQLVSIDLESSVHRQPNSVCSFI